MPDPQTQYASLINKQTQLEESVPLSEVQARLAAGTHLAGPDTQVEQEVVPGVTGGFDPAVARAREQIGVGQVPQAAASRMATDRIKAYKAEYDNAGDEALAFVDGVLSGASGGMLEGIPVGDNPLAEDARKMRGMVNDQAKMWGELTAIAATVIPSPVTGALKYTPLGAANEVQKAVTAGTRALLPATAGSRAGVIAGAAADAAGGAAAMALLSSGAQIAHAIQGKPVSGYAIVDDIGLGAVVSGALGMVGGAFQRQAAKIKNAQKEIQAAGRFDEQLPASHGAVSEGIRSWESAHADSVRRLRALDDMERKGLLDASLSGEEWLGTRRAAAKHADIMQKNLFRVAGATDMAGVTRRAQHIMEQGTAKEVEKLAAALDDYGTAVNILDERLKPSSLDKAHLLDLDALDTPGMHELGLPGAEFGLGGAPVAANRSTLHVLGDMIEQGADDVTLRQFARDHNLGDLPISAVEEAAGVGKVVGESTEAVTKVGKARGVKEPSAGPKSAVTKVEKTKAIADEVAPQPATVPGERPTVTIPRGPTKVIGEQHGPFRFEGPEYHAPQPHIAGVSGKNAFKAYQILNEAKWAKSAYPTTKLGEQLETIVKNLETATGGRLGTEEARLLAQRLGVNLEKVRGPLAQRYVDMWSLRKLAEAVADETSTASKAVRTGPGALGKAIKSGAITKARSGARKAIGPFAAGAFGSLVGGWVGAVLGAAGTLGSTAGRMRQHAVLGVAKALNPVGRRAAAFSALTPVKTSYDGSPDTDKFEKKAEQIRFLAAAPDVLRRRAEDGMAEIRALDPLAASSAVEASITRLQNLNKNLPQGTYMGPMLPPGPPSPEEIEIFQQYEAITYDRTMVFEYLRAGAMPDSVVSAMREQHPDFLSEIEQYILDNPEVIEKAPHNTAIAFSKLLGIPFVPEADPMYVKRQQIIYDEKKQKALQAQQAQQGASMMRGGMPAPLPMTPAQQYTALPQIR